MTEKDDLVELADSLTPLEADMLCRCVERGSTRTNDGGLSDALLSILCSKPSLERALVKWRANPGYRTDGYVSLYEPTDLGREVAAALRSRASLRE